jgi:hypothetical protein
MKAAVNTDTSSRDVSLRGTRRAVFVAPRRECLSPATAANAPSGRAKKREELGKSVRRRDVKRRR